MTKCNWGWRTGNEERRYATSESLNDAHCTSSLGSLKDRQGYCYDSFTYFSPLIFLVYSLHARTSCLLFLVYILIFFYRLSFLSCTALLFKCSLMHSTITHAQSCTVCLGCDMGHTMGDFWLYCRWLLVIPHLSPVTPHPWQVTCTQVQVEPQVLFGCCGFNVLRLFTMVYSIGKQINKCNLVLQNTILYI